MHRDMKKMTTWISAIKMITMYHSLDYSWLIIPHLFCSLNYGTNLPALANLLQTKTFSKKNSNPTFLRSYWIIISVLTCCILIVIHETKRFMKFNLFMGCPYAWFSMPWSLCGVFPSPVLWCFYPFSCPLHSLGCSSELLAVILSYLSYLLPQWLSIGATLTPRNQVENSHATPGLLPATAA